MLYARPLHGTSKADGEQQWQPLVRHLVDVSQICRGLAAAITDDQRFHHDARVAGLLHDLGKARAEWQAMLRDSVAGNPKRRVRHAIHGASAAKEMGYLDVSFAIAGHHAGIPDQSGGDGLDEQCARFSQESKDAIDAITQEFSRVSEGELPSSAPVDLSEHLDARRFDLRTRMLASVLVDADRTNSASGSGTYESRELLNPDRYLERLLDDLAQRSARTRSVSVRGARHSVLQSCLEAASYNEKLVSLNAPTGSGKTLATLAFALQRAALRPGEIRRIIVVLPFLTIIEQNAQEILNLFGSKNVLEHHSGEVIARVESEELDSASELRRQLAANWNVPIIVTTNVRFFQTLFSNHPSDLRRLHSIAKSLVILDEVQTFPRHYVAPMWSMINGLANDFGTNFLFASATLPDFAAEVARAGRAGRSNADSAVREILPDRASLHSALRRVEVTWSAAIESIEQVAERVSAYDQVLVIVNVRHDARDLYEALCAKLSAGSVLHLSTLMCPAHRSDTIRELKRRLDSGLECRVVSTQLIEAGVDISFPVVFRAIGPLDSIAQAAGRCDREGVLTTQYGRPAGRVEVFDLGTDHDLPPGTSYRQGSETVRGYLQAGLRPDLANPALFDAYYEEWYGKGELDLRNIQPRRVSRSFRELAKEFRYIDDVTRRVVVPYGDEGASISRKLLNGILLDSEEWNVLQRHAVGLRDWEFQRLSEGGAIYRANEELELWAATESAYDTRLGLVGDSLLEL